MGFGVARSLLRAGFRTHACDVRPEALQQFESEAGALEPAAAGSVCDEIADQLEHEALRATSRHRRDVLLAAVKGFDGMSFAGAKT